ncbi:MAG: hypothetical protein ACRD8A_10205 [Candidatus Acidiferrales bacterium]
MFRRSSGSGVFAVVLVLAVTFGMAVRSLRAHTDSNQKSRSTASNETMMPMPLIAPLFVANSDFRSTLVLVNGSGAPASADVAIRASDGVQLATRHVTLFAYSQQKVDLDTLLADKGIGSAIGSLVVTPDAKLKGPSILAALSMTYLGSREGNFIDEELAMPMPSDSQVLRGVTDSSTGPPMIAVSSLADTPQRVTIQCFGANSAGFLKTIGLGAGQTVLTDACSNRPATAPDLNEIWNNDPRHRRIVQAISLTSDGMPGSFAAFGLSPHQTANDRHFSSMAFSDPKMAASPSLVFTGVPVGEPSILPGRTYVPEISVANFSAKPARVRIQYASSSPSASGDTTNTVQQVWSGSVAAQATTRISFDQLQGDPNLCDSLVVSSNASPGDIVAKLSSVTDGGFQQAEMLAKDESDPDNVGVHPWSLENGTDSTLLLLNNSQAQQTFHVNLTANGLSWRKAYTLKPMQTTNIDISEVIAKRAKDDTGNVLPAHSMSGVATWIVAQHGVGKGRVLQSNATTGMARSFSCNYYGAIAGAEWSSAASGVLVGDTVNAGSVLGEIELVQGYGCSGTFEDWGQGSGWTYSYSSSNPSDVAVTTPDGPSAYVKGMAGGQVQISGTIQDQYGCSGGASGAVTGQVPTYLKVVQVNVLPTGSSGNYGCTPTSDYGIQIDIEYQVEDSSLNPIQSPSMTPYETGESFFGDSFANDVGPSRISDTSKNTSSTGIFHDAPFGVCQTAPYTTGEIPFSAQQNLSIIVGGTYYPVRSQNWTMTDAIGSYGLDHGSIHNTITSGGSGMDVNASR